MTTGTQSSPGTVIWLLRSLGSLDAYLDGSAYSVLSRKKRKSWRALRGQEDWARRELVSRIFVLSFTCPRYSGYGFPLETSSRRQRWLMKAVKRFETERQRASRVVAPLDRAEIHEYVLRNWRLVRSPPRKLSASCSQLRR